MRKPTAATVLTTALAVLALLFVPGQILADEEEVEVEGTVTDVTGDTFTVEGYTFTITSSTKFYKGNRNQLEVGVSVEAEGYYRTDVLYADEVEFKRGGDDDKGGGDDDNGRGKPGGDEVEIKGTVSSYDGDLLIVGSTEFAITARTIFAGGISRTTLETGMEVEVEGSGETMPYNAFKVKLIRDDDDEMERDERNDYKVIASVESAGGVTTVTFEDGETVEMDSHLAVHGRHGLPSRANDLIEGLRLKVLFKNITNGTGQIVTQVKMIQIVGHENEDGIVGSNVGSSAVMLESLTIDGEVFYYDDVTRIIGDNGSITKPENIPAGEHVTVLANPLVEEGYFLANKIIMGTDDDDDEDDGLKGPVTRLTGVITSVTGSGDSISQFSVDGVAVTTDEDTFFNVFRYDGPFDMQYFEVGMEVIAKVKGSADSGYHAKAVFVVLPVTKYAGEIEAIGSDSLTLFDTEITVTEYTDFEDDLTGLSDLTVGDVVEVRTILWPDGTEIAAEIELEDDDFNIRGEITDIAFINGNNYIYIGDIEIMIPTDARILTVRNYERDFTDLKVGMTVKVILEEDLSDPYVAKLVRIF